MKSIVQRAINVLNVVIWMTATFFTWADKSGFMSFATMILVGLGLVLTLNYVLFGKLTIWNDVKKDE